MRENQALGSELSGLVRQRDLQADELRRLSARASAAEQLVRAKDAEVEDLRKAYEELALVVRADGSMAVVY